MHFLYADLRPDQFFQQVRGARQRVLMLDYDGTLAPFRAQRYQAVPYPSVRETLADLLATGQTRLIVISGRSIGGLRPLLGLAPTPELWGSHGWERLWPDGVYQRADLPASARVGLDEAYHWAEQAGLVGQCERKPASIAWHWRGLAPTAITELEPMVKDRWTDIGQAHGLVVLPFDGGLELRSPARTKGDAVETILAEAGPDVVAAYLGDDLTDEDAFTAIAGRGLGVLVRAELRPTAAALWLRPPEELLAFLRAWRRASAP